MVSARAPTEDTDLIAEDIVQWTKAQFDLLLEPFKPIAHSSQLEIQFQRSLPELVPFLTPVGTAITEALDGFWDMHHELTGVYFVLIKLKATKFAPSPFRIERRADIPYEMNLYFCEAPLSTSNTITVLERFERICLANFP